MDRFLLVLRRLLTALFALVPLGANATIISVDYAGTIDGITGSGLGYSVGDPISGTLYIDSTLAEVISSSPDYGADHTLYESADPHFVVGGQVGTGYEFPINRDAVVVENRTGPGGFDVYRVISGSESGYFFSYVQGLRIEDDVLDFIAGTSLFQTFALTPSDFINSPNYVYRGGLSDFSRPVLNSVGFALSSVDVRAVSIPEPGTLTLLGAGLFGIFAMRRRRAS